MKSLEEMIEVEELRFIEPDYASLVNNGEPAVLICEAKPAAGGARILLDEEGNPLLFAVNNEGVWFATSWMFRDPTPAELALFEAADGASPHHQAIQPPQHTPRHLRHGHNA